MSDTQRRYCQNCREETLHDKYLYDNHPNPGHTRRVTPDKAIFGTVVSMGLFWLNVKKVAECQKCNKVTEI